jgi:hypothetical protein
MAENHSFYMRLFYTRFPIFQALPGKLSWTHLLEIIDWKRNYRETKMKSQQNHTLTPGKKEIMLDFICQIFQNLVGNSSLADFLIGKMRVFPHFTYQ